MVLSLYSTVYTFVKLKICCFFFCSGQMGIKWTNLNPKKMVDDIDKMLNTAAINPIKDLLERVSLHFLPFVIRIHIANE